VAAQSTITAAAIGAPTRGRIRAIVVATAARTTSAAMRPPG